MAGCPTVGAARIKLMGLQVMVSIEFGTWVLTMLSGGARRIPTPVVCGEDESGTVPEAKPCVTYICAVMFSAEASGVGAEGATPLPLSRGAHCDPGTLKPIEVCGLGCSVSVIVFVPPSTSESPVAVTADSSTTLLSDPRGVGTSCVTKAALICDQSMDDPKPNPGPLRLVESGPSNKPICGGPEMAKTKLTTLASGTESSPDKLKWNCVLLIAPVVGSGPPAKSSPASNVPALVQKAEVPVCSQ